MQRQWRTAVSTDKPHPGLIVRRVGGFLDRWGAVRHGIIEHRLSYRVNRPRVAIMVRFDNLLDVGQAQLLYFPVDRVVSPAYPRGQPIPRPAEEPRRRPERERRSKFGHHRVSRTDEAPRCLRLHTCRVSSGVHTRRGFEKVRELVVLREVARQPLRDRRGFGQLTVAYQHFP